MNYGKKNKKESTENHQSLCVELLSVFSEKEVNNLIHFINCRYFNTDRYVIKLLDVLKKQVVGRRQFGEAVKADVYEKVFTDTVKSKGLNVIQKKRLGAKLNALTRLTEQFLATDAFRQHEIYQNDLLLQELLDKKQYQLFNRHINKMLKKQETDTQKNTDHYEHNYKIEYNRLNYLYRSGKIVNKEDNLSELIYQLDLHYLLNKLSLYITLLSMELSTSKTYDKASMEAITSLLDLPQYAGHPFVSVCRATVDLMKFQTEEAYHNLLKLLDVQASSIPKAELNGIYITITNFCAQQIKKGGFDHNELFNLYQMMDNRGLFIEGNFMSEVRLKNVVATACRVEEYEWAVNLVEKYRPFIRKPVRESVCQLNLGIIAFYQKDYKVAIHHFIRVDNVNLNYDINCRIMMMKSYYEIDEDYDERTMQIFRSTEKFFNENKALPQKTRKGYKNFIRTLINLYRIRHRATKMKLEQINEKLEQQEVNSDKYWLREKIMEIGG